MHTHWHPKWWKDEHESAWDRVREAVRRDWQQTKHDLHAGGHELNQGVKDTVKQAAGKEAIPDINKANPPKVVGQIDGEWEKVEAPLEYGFAARQQFGSQHAQWNEKLETQLKSEWETENKAQKGLWSDVKPYVRKGYDYKS